MTLAVLPSGRPFDPYFTDVIPAGPFGHRHAFICAHTPRGTRMYRYFPATDKLEYAQPCALNDWSDWRDVTHKQFRTAMKQYAFKVLDHVTKRAVDSSPQPNLAVL
jgi:hypothetical protein